MKQTFNIGTKFFIRLTYKNYQTIVLSNIWTRMHFKIVFSKGAKLELLCFNKDKLEWIIPYYFENEKEICVDNRVEINTLGRNYWKNANIDLSLLESREEFSDYIKPRKPCFEEFVMSVVYNMYNFDYYIECTTKRNKIRRYKFKEYINNKYNVKNPVLYIKGVKIDYNYLLENSTEIIYDYLYNSDLYKIDNHLSCIFLEKGYLNYFVINKLIDIDKFLINRKLYVPLDIHALFYMLYGYKYDIISRVSLRYGFYKEFDVENLIIKHTDMHLVVGATKINIKFKGWKPVIVYWQCPYTYTEKMSEREFYRSIKGKFIKNASKEALYFRDKKFR